MSVAIEVFWWDRQHCSRGCTSQPGAAAQAGHLDPCHGILQPGGCTQGLVSKLLSHVESFLLIR